LWRERCGVSRLKKYKYGTKHCGEYHCGCG
jgi:hypothetical protein